MQNYLTGLARRWYNNLTIYTYTWDEWNKKQSNECMTPYYFHKMNLIQTCNITGKNVVSCLIGGLKDRTLQNGSNVERYETAEDLYRERERH
ncbi:hypothetical protein RI129_003256 [Pyrocoelia pectoralis]|uniref:Uncharacterized protein n=1 Tax=Pyrocoelia pectoralis TaxID=417401 RepID=A0AAN7VRD2_9COLE